MLAKYLIQKLSSKGSNDKFYLGSSPVIIFDFNKGA